MQTNNMNHLSHCKGTSVITATDILSDFSIAYH